ncbi:hypothetical protein ACFYYL_01855 [Actinomadura geliboluensis]|uniref:hypothetical protein n=1 Tax=Actinomadura geliboluensis TaxID=882440 RepID=UPI00369FAEE8
MRADGERRREPPPRRAVRVGDEDVVVAVGPPLGVGEQRGDLAVAVAARRHLRQQLAQRPQRVPGPGVLEDQPRRVHAGGAGPLRVVQRPERRHRGPGAPRRLAGPPRGREDVRGLRVQPRPHLRRQRRGAPVQRVDDPLRLRHVARRGERPRVPGPHRRRGRPVAARLHRPGGLRERGRGLGGPPLPLELARALQQSAGIPLNHHRTLRTEPYRSR